MSWLFCARLRVLGLAWLVLALVAGPAFSASAGAALDVDLYESALRAIAENRRVDAEQALLALRAAEPRHAGAWLDLAMLFCSAGDAVAAEAVFAEIELRFAPPPPIVEVMARQRVLGCSAPVAPGRAVLRLGQGFDANVNQGPMESAFSWASGASQVELVLLPAYLPQGGAFTSVSGEFSRALGAGVLGSVAVHGRVFEALPAYNSRSLLLGAERPWRLGGWGLGVAGSVGATVLADQLCLRQVQVLVSGVPPLVLPEHWGLAMSQGWSAVAYPAVREFDARWLESRGVLTFERPGVGWQVSASAVQDVALGKRPGGDRAGVLLGWQGRFGFVGGTAELGWQGQRWAGSEVYSPGMVDVARVQNLSIWRAAATLPVTAQGALVVELKLTQSVENVPIFSFRSQVLQVGWVWQL